MDRRESTKAERDERRKQVEKAATEYGVKCLDSFFHGKRSGLLFECSKGHQFRRQATKAIKAGLECPGCKEEEKAERFAEILRKCEEVGVTTTATNYVGYKRRMTFRCSNGHEFERQAGGVLDRSALCPHCKGERKHERAWEHYERAWMRWEVDSVRFPEWAPLPERRHNKGFKRRWSLSSHWLACSKCLGRIGLGPLPVSRILAVARLAVVRKWKLDGFERTPPVEGNPRTTWGSLREQRLKYGLPMDHEGAARFRRIRKGLRKRLKEYQDSNGARYRSDIGCDWATFEKWIESQWEPGMSWENHGPDENGKWKGRWQIDHRDPLARIDLGSKHQVERVNHFTNLRPLWAGDNMERGAAFGEEIEVELPLGYHGGQGFELKKPITPEP